VDSQSSRCGTEDRASIVVDGPVGLIRRWRDRKDRFSKFDACQRESLFVNQDALIFMKSTTLILLRFVALYVVGRRHG